MPYSTVVIGIGNHKSIPRLCTNGVPSAIFGRKLHGMPESTRIIFWRIKFHKARENWERDERVSCRPSTREESTPGYGQRMPLRPKTILSIPILDACILSHIGSSENCIAAAYRTSEDGGIAYLCNSCDQPIYGMYYHRKDCGDLAHLSIDVCGRVCLKRRDALPKGSGHRGQG